MKSRRSCSRHWQQDLSIQQQILLGLSPIIFVGWLYEVAAEQKARVTYDNILRMSDDPDVNDVIKFLRQREVVHFQRFGESMEQLRQKLNQKNVYCMNPAKDL